MTEILPNYELFGMQSIEEAMQEISSQPLRERKTIVRSNPSSPDTSPSRDENNTRNNSSPRETRVAWHDASDSPTFSRFNVNDTRNISSPTSSRFDSIKTPEKKAKVDIPMTEESLRKTEMCKQFQAGKPCKFGKKCHFAHGVFDLKTRNRHTRFKTTLCDSFHNKGFCNYGDRCSFIHDETIYLDERAKSRPTK